MTVYEGKLLLLKRYKCDRIDHLLQQPSQEDFEPALTILHWLHAISSDHMEKLYGPDYGRCANLPNDIDKATIMTDEQVVELKQKWDEGRTPAPVGSLS